LRTPYNFCPDCNSPEVYPASFAPKMYHCHDCDLEYDPEGCDLEYEPEKFEGLSEYFIRCGKCGKVRDANKGIYDKSCPHCGETVTPF
jgi:hypothetical protein